MEIEQNKYRELLDELKRLTKLEERLNLAIGAHEVYLQATEGIDFAYPLTKKIALEFTLGVLTDIRDDK